MELGKNSFENRIAEKLAIEDYYQKISQYCSVIVKDYKIGDNNVDLYFERNGNKFAYVFKTANTLKDSRQLFEKLRHDAMSIGIHFRIILVHLPKEKEIYVEGIENTIYSAFIEKIPDDLDALSSHTQIDEIDEVELFVCKIKGGQIYLEGKSVVLVALCYGSGDEEICHNDAFPFEFKGCWSYDNNGKLQLTEFLDLKIDTSSFEK